MLLIKIMTAVGYLAMIDSQMTHTGAGWVKAGD